MRVRTKHRHDNAYGDVYTKNPGKIYEHPAPEPLIAAGWVEKADGKSSSGRTSGTAKLPAGTTEGNAEEHHQASAAEGA